MKKIVCLISTAVLCAAAMPVLSVSATECVTYDEYKSQAEERAAAVYPDPDAAYTNVTEGDLVFHVYEKYAALAECKNTDAAEISIPAEVQGVPVTGLADIPFSHCRKLTSITLPDNFTHFRWDNLVNTVMVKLGSDEDPMPSVTAVKVSETNPNYTVSEGLLYSKDMKTLIGCPPALEMKKLKISEQAETIGDYAFWGCMKLENAVIPENIKHINNNAFTGCMGLQHVELPESISALSGDVFYYCTALTEVLCKGKLTAIGMGAFSECSALKDFQIPDTVECIGWRAFEKAGCVETVDGLQYVQKWLVGSDDNIGEAKLRNGTIGAAEMAFFAKKQVETIEIPPSVQYFGAAIAGTAFVPTVIQFRAGNLPEKTVMSAKSMTDIYIYDADCAIFDSEKTIPASYQYQNPEQEIGVITLDVMQNKKITGDTVIHGYAGSTAEAYAKKYNRKFEHIKPNGDVNSDGVISVADAVLLQKWLLTVPDTKLADRAAADLNEDGILDGADLSRLKKKIWKTET